MNGEEPKIIIFIQIFLFNKKIKVSKFVQHMNKSMQKIMK